MARSPAFLCSPDSPFAWRGAYAQARRGIAQPRPVVDVLGARVGGQLDIEPVRGAGAQKRRELPVVGGRERPDPVEREEGPDAEQVEAEPGALPQQRRDVLA